MKTGSAVLLLLLATSPLAAQPRQPKNVQILKGLSNDQLIRTMQFMAGSLGVSCDFCHVMPPGGERDFASDAKEEKKTARQMIQLVLDTNAKFFDNELEVTCQTCHRGSPRPAGSLALPVAAPAKREAPPGTAEQKPATPTRDELVTRYAKAIGKADAKAVASIELKGTRETARGSAPIDVVMAGGRTRIATTTPEGEMVNVISGSSSWLHDTHGTRVMEPAEVEGTVEILEALRLPLPSDVPSEGRIGKDRINDRDVWILSSPWKSGRQRLYFDAETNLLVRRTTSTPLPVGNFPQQADFDDYRDVGGFKLPFMVRYESADRGAARMLRYSEIVPNAKIDPSVFEQK